MDLNGFAHSILEHTKRSKALNAMKFNSAFIRRYRRFVLDIANAYRIRYLSNHLHRQDKNAIAD